VSSFDIVTVGHFSIDRIKLPNRNGTTPTLGGPPTYVSLAAKKLGANVSVVSKVGADFPERFRRLLERRGVNLSGLRVDANASTTSFFLNYSLGGERELYLKKRASQIETEDIPDFLDSKVVHVAPIANEVHLETLRKLKSLGSIVSLDPQGFIRRFGENGKMRNGQLENFEVLNGVSVLKASYDEAKAITGRASLINMVESLCKRGAKTVIVTRGAEPTILHVEGKTFSVPPAKPKTVVDPTGAGDVFIGAFLTMLVRGEEPLWCACAGSAAASFVVEKCGPSGFGSPTQVQVRAEEVYDKVSSIP
jgi:sugar/nucleoside kinase (ribokinase family)